MNFVTSYYEHLQYFYVLRCVSNYKFECKQCAQSKCHIILSISSVSFIRVFLHEHIALQVILIEKGQIRFINWNHNYKLQHVSWLATNVEKWIKILFWNSQTLNLQTEARVQHNNEDLIIQFTFVFFNFFYYLVVIAGNAETMLIKSWASFWPIKSLETIFNDSNCILTAEKFPKHIYESRSWKIQCSNSQLIYVFDKN